jgi:predicted RNase H-like nuclease (RuvC/YqgF family)
MIGENTFLKLRLRVENYEHQVDDLKAYIKQLERKLKKYENNNIGAAGNGENNNIIRSGGRVHSTRSAA